MPKNLRVWGLDGSTALASASLPARPASWEAREELDQYQFHLQRAWVGSAGDDQAACLMSKVPEVAAL